MITYGNYTDPNNIDCYEGVNLIIGKYCSIASGLKIYSGEHPCIDHPEIISQYPFHEHFRLDYPRSKYDGKVTIGNDVWVATDVGILEGVTIGDGAIIGARSMVTKDVPPYTLVAGNPARIKRFRFTDGVIQSLLKIKWWNWTVNEINQAIPEMKDVNKFIQKYESKYN